MTRKKDRFKRGDKEQFTLNAGDSIALIAHYLWRKYAQKGRDNMVVDFDYNDDEQAMQIKVSPEATDTDRAFAEAILYTLTELEQDVPKTAIRFLNNNEVMREASENALKGDPY